MTPKPSILTIDRNQRNLELLAQFLNKEGYETRPVSNLEGITEVLEAQEKFGLALVDISGFDRTIWEYCEKLSNNGVPLMVISPQQASSIRQQSLAHGAQGILYKPLVVKELTMMIHNLFQEYSDE